MTQRDTLLTPDEVSRFYKASIWSRPVTLYSLTGVMVAVCLTTCYMVIMEKATLTDASGILMAIVGAVFPIIGVQILGKSYEKVKGASEEQTVVPAASQPSTPVALPTTAGTPVAVANSLLVGEPNSAVISLDRLANNPDLAVLGDDPIALLNGLNLDEYMPKIADDKPVMPDLEPTMP
jgi:hypothetical protein